MWTSDDRACIVTRAAIHGSVATSKRSQAVVSKNTNARNWLCSNDLRPIVLVVEWAK